MQKLNRELLDLKEKENKYQLLLQEKKKKRDINIFLPLFFMRRYLSLLAPVIITAFLCILFKDFAGMVVIILLIGLLAQILFFVIACLDPPLWSTSVEENTLAFLQDKETKEQENKSKKTTQQRKKEEFISLRDEAKARKDKIDFLQFVIDNPKVLKDLKEKGLL